MKDPDYYISQRANKSLNGFGAIIFLLVLAFLAGACFVGMIR